MIVLRDPWVTDWRSDWTEVDFSTGGGDCTRSVSGGLGRISTAAVGVNACAVTYNGDTNIIDGEVFATHQATSTGNRRALWARYDGAALGSANGYRAVCWDSIPGKINLEKVVAGVATGLGSLNIGGGFTLPWYIKLQCIGTTIRVKEWDADPEPEWGGAETLSVTDSSITAGGRWGLGLHSVAISTTHDYADTWVDNFLPAEVPGDNSTRSLLTR